MYLTAQRVRRARDGREGINAFYYVSQLDVWAPEHEPPFTPDEDPGVLENQILTVPPPGNRVRSYLDVVAEDFTPLVTIRRSFAIAAGQIQPAGLPFDVVVGACWFRFNAEAALVHVWRHEMGLLFEWAVMTYQQTFNPAIVP